MQIQTISDLKRFRDMAPPTYSLKGLIQGKVGLLIGAPWSAKSEISLSICIEHASSLRTLGLSVATEPRKTLYVSTEDPVSIVAGRVSDITNTLPLSVQKELDENFHFLADDEIPPFVGDFSNPEYLVHFRHLVGLFKSYELVVIDTLSEAIGCFDEVKDDKQIKESFKRLAQESGASLLLIHHVGKEEIRGRQKITMASGTGLSSLMKLTKFLLSVSMEENGSRLEIRYQKGNYLSAEQRNNILLTKEVESRIIMSQNCYQLNVDEGPQSRHSQSLVELLQPSSSSERLSGRHTRTKRNSGPKSIVIETIDEFPEPDDDLRDTL